MARRGPAQFVDEKFGGDCSFICSTGWCKIRPSMNGNIDRGHGRPCEKRVSMKGFIAAAGRGSRLQDLGEKRNKVLSDLGGETILGNLLGLFEQAGITQTIVAVGFDAQALRTQCGQRAQCLLNPFFVSCGILSSVWLARPHLEGSPFLFTVGDHYLESGRLRSLLADQPEADILVDVELKKCDDEDMKVFVNRSGGLRTMTKACLDGNVLGEFTGMFRCSAEGSTQFFDMLEKHVWQHGIEGFVADILCTTHRKWPLAFHLSADHRRVDVDFPCDLARARELFGQASPSLAS
jgi:choline kinase